jgi:hypothetical protein
MGKKWKRLLVHRRANGRVEMPSARPDPVVSNSEMIERMEAAATEPEVVEEEVVATEPEVVEEEPVVEPPKLKRRRSTSRRKTKSED